VSVEKFRSIEEMNGAPIRAVADHAFERFLRHCARYWAIAPRHYPRGVFRFHGIEEAQAARALVARQSSTSPMPPAPSGPRTS
jgi:hypothetical protein